MAVVGNIDFLARDVLYDKQKPYRMKFVPPSGFPWSNIKTNIQPQKIEDIRGREKDFSLGANGFSLETLDSGMTYEDFDDEDKIVQTYLPNVAKLLRSMLNPSRIQIFEFLVRKRGESFPLATETAYEDHQPTTAAHIGL
ncbi:uncharacterized protein N7496_009693 [Penicillium cataractarum]|uniref:Uncharacterized protein n=1 Tax=Penicillium cataractarum TaxID=2100454 RepID=A0A9W9RPE9_9EURO|nr:uncharacterized protein N7496_009693 [Penicillium cataractarum]KAJ5363980.1 hypothetical protein N7496_009693 [Penicillium cataractarum]